MRTHPLRSVLAATDLTAVGELVLRAAAALARASGAALHVVHAFDLDLDSYPEAAGLEPTFQGRVAAAEDGLERQIALAVPDDVPLASRSVVIFAAHRAILMRAAQVEVDVVVVGAHRAGGARGRLGTTADHVVRSAACPCLVLRAPLRLPLARVVVAMDLSDPARGALETALDWMDAAGIRAAGDLPGAELDVVHVVPRLFEAGDLPVNRATIEPRLHADVEQVLAARDLPPAVREELVWGDGPADEIVRYARERRADLLVLATHGRGAVGRALIGSVSSAVAQRATTPVLLVPPARWAGWSGGAAQGGQGAGGGG